jgi:hypothetical protein
LSKPVAAATFSRMSIVSTRPANGNGLAAKHDDGAGHDDGTGDVVVLCAEEEIRDVLAYWLGAMPARMVVAKALQNGCRWLVTDRVLSPWPGLDTFVTLRARHPRLRIAFIESGNLHDGILARVTGASVLLQRPLNRQTIVEALAQTQPQS